MSDQKKGPTSTSSSLFMYLNIFLGFCVILIGVVYQFLKTESATIEVIRPKNDDIYQDLPPIPLFSPEDLAQYDGKTKPQLYLSIMGEVFDVSRGDKHYGPDQTYNAFIGKDISRAFVTGEFDKKSSKDSLDHVLALSPSELVNLKKWRDFYKENYDFVGRLIGRFYEDNGKPTEYFWQIERKVQFGLKQQAEEQKLKSVFPPCNIEYKNKVTKFWCTNRSGGIERDWAGYPIQLFDQDSKTYTCVCLEKDSFDLPQLRLYSKCDDTKRSCWVYEDEEQVNED